MGHHGNSFISFGAAIAEMGDLEFIQDKVIAGDYFQVSGAIDALNDTIKFIVPNLKTAFLIEAKIVITGHTSGSTTKDMVEAELKIDGTVIDTTNIGTATTQATGIVNSATDMMGGFGWGSGAGTIGDGKFNVLGISLVGDGIKVIEIENTLDDGTAFATMSGYLITT